MFVYLIVAQVWVFGDDSENDNSQLVLQSKALLYRNSRRKSFQTAVDIQNHLIVFWMCAQFFQCWHGVALLSINSEKKRPHTAS